MASNKRFQSAALQYTYGRFIAGDPEQEDAYEEASFDSEVALLIYESACVSESCRHPASVICRLEDADYEGHSLAMLRQVAQRVA